MDIAAFNILDLTSLFLIQLLWERELNYVDSSSALPSRYQA